MGIAHIFLGLLDTGRDLRLGSESLVFRRIYLIFSEYRKGSFDTEFLDADLSAMGGHGSLSTKGGWARGAPGGRERRR